MQKKITPVSEQPTEKLNQPKIEEVSEVYVKTATIKITDPNSSDQVNEKGIVWSKENKPSIEDNQILSTHSDPTFTIKLDSLQEKTTYFVRAYAKSNAEITYSKEINFTTLSGIY